MNMLLEMETLELFNRIMELKDCYDCGGKRIIEIVSEYGTEIDLIKREDLTYQNVI